MCGGKYVGMSLYGIPLNDNFDKQGKNLIPSDMAFRNYGLEKDNERSKALRLYGSNSGLLEDLK